MTKLNRTFVIIVIGLLIAACGGGPSSSEFEIKGEEAKLTKNMGSILVLNQLVRDIGDHVKGSMNTVMNDDKLKQLKTISLRYEVKSNGNDNLGVAYLKIPVAEWQQIPKEKRENGSWVARNMERWKYVINNELVTEIRRMKRKFG